MRRGRARAREREAQLTDALLEAYVTWREACEDTARTYSQWRAAGSDRRLAHERYRAALQAEEDAATSYGEAAARLTAGLQSGPCAA